MNSYSPLDGEEGVAEAQLTPPAQSVANAIGFGGPQSFSVVSDDWWSAIHWCPSRGEWGFVSGWQDGSGSLEYPLYPDEAGGVWLYFLDAAGNGHYAESVWFTHVKY